MEFIPQHLKEHAYYPSIRPTIPTHTQGKKNQPEVKKREETTLGFPPEQDQKPD
jgi:hypothetical protein